VTQSRLVRDLMVFIRRYVVVSREQLLVTALWIIHTTLLSTRNGGPSGASL
jgi:hypothetical protein